MKRRSPLFWILVGVGTPIALGVAAIVGLTGYALIHNASLMNELHSIRDPRLRMARLAAAADPELDVKVDENAGTITLRNKKTGNFRMVTFADIGSPKKAAPNFPSWVGLYPAASLEFVASTREESKGVVSQGAMFILTTSEPVSKVMDFYKERIQALGLTLETSDENNRGFLKAAGERRSLSVSVEAGAADGQTQVQLEYEEKQ